MTKHIDTINTMPAVFANAAGYIAFHGVSSMWEAIVKASRDAVDAGASFSMAEPCQFAVAVMDASAAAYKPMPITTKEEQIKACGKFCDIAHRMENWVL